MKKTLMFSAMALTLLAALSGCKSTPEITALVKGKECKVVALDLEYEAAIDPASVSTETFVVEGEEVAFAKVTEPEHVLIVLKRECKGEGCKGEGCGKGDCEKEGCDKADCEKVKADCEKAGCDKAECEKAKAECCKAKAEGEKAKAECCKAKAECCKAKAEGEKDGCKKSKCCKDKDDDELPVPKVSVQQVADLKTLDGKTVKAWKSARPATDVEFVGRGKGKCKGSCDDCD